jgi:hypothetical protein
MENAAQRRFVEGQLSTAGILCIQPKNWKKSLARAIVMNAKNSTVQPSHQSKAKVHYGDVTICLALGQFDIAVMGSVLTLPRSAPDR